MRARFRFVPFLGPVVLLSLLPATGSTQGLVALTAGFRGRAADNVRAAPMLGFGVTPIRGGWVALGLELSWAPRMTQSDSGAFHTPGFSCADPQGNPTTCASERDVFGESTLQIGATVSVGPRHRRTAPFAELALGYYGTNSKEGRDVWDPTGLHLTNASYDELARRQDGAYARVGLGVQMKPWSRGPGLTVSARYRWARGDLLGEYTYLYHRDGPELVLGVRL